MLSAHKNYITLCKKLWLNFASVVTVVSFINTCKSCLGYTEFMYTPKVALQFMVSYMVMIPIVAYIQYRKDRKKTIGRK